ncbi:MAG: glutamine-hydrolyzing GMP synthase, partial [Clostridia bacterium]|nr:glutamine-hydrolyzing GMP synthase [Clostridia bacterium]
MEKVLVLDFGGQYNQLIARRVREQHIYAEIKPYDRITPEEIKKAKYKGVIFTGGPNSVYDPASPHYDPEVLNLGIPILGICYGAQLMAFMAGGTVSDAGESGEYGKTKLSLSKSTIFRGIPSGIYCWMSHRDFISKLPDGFKTIAVTDKCPCAAMSDVKRKLYAVQFHPEVTHTEYGREILTNFLYGVCGCSGDWYVEDYTGELIEKYKTELAGKKVLLALSG